MVIVPAALLLRIYDGDVFIPPQDIIIISDNNIRINNNNVYGIIKIIVYVLGCGVL